MAVFLINGFETADASQITTIGAGQSVVAGSGFLTGNQTFRNDGTGAARAVTTFASQGASSKARVYGQCKFYLTDLTPTSGWTTDIHLYDGSGNFIGAIIWGYDASYAPDPWWFALNCSDGTATGQTNIIWAQLPSLDDKWYTLEWDIPCTNPGTATLWLDGTELGQASGNFRGANAVEIRYGMVAGGALGENLDLDDLVLSDSARVGTATTRCNVIARPFKAGTPTYDSFTKSTGAIEDVWDDRPFDAATYARSALSGVSQTALLASFSADAGGPPYYGGGTIAATATIQGAIAALVAKTAYTTAAGISLVGTPQGGSSTNGTDITLSLTTGAAAVAGDVVVVTGGHILRTGTSYGPDASLGYTQIGTLQTTGSSGTGHAFGAWYKVMGPTPDTSVVCKGSGTNGDGAAYTSRILRGVDNSNVLDAVAVFAGPTTSTNPNPPSITPTTTGAAVVMSGASLVSDTNIGGASNYVGQATGNAAATRPYGCSSLHRLGLTGSTPEDPPAIGSTGNGWSSGIWFSVSIAIKPAAQAGSAASIRRRLGGSDTDLAITLGTTDAFFLTTPFSATLTDLNASEVGLLHGGTSALQTVEDAFLMVAYTPAEATVYQNDGRFAGAGVLGATASQRLAASAQYAGAGTLSADAKLYTFAAATLAGASTLSGVIMQVQRAAATLAGVSSLAADAKLFKFASATLVGQSNFFVDGTVVVGAVTWQVGATFAGLGNFAASSFVVRPAAAVLPGVSTFAAYGYGFHPGVAALAGVGTLAAYAYVWRPGVAALAGAGVLAADAKVFKSATATLQAAGGFSAYALTVRPAAAMLAGVGAFSAYALTVRPAAALLPGVGDFAATARQVDSVAALLAGVSTLYAVGQQAGVWQASAEFDGAGALSAYSYVARPGAAVLAGASTLFADATVVLGATVWEGQAIIVGEAVVAAVAVKATTRLVLHDPVLDGGLEVLNTDADRIYVCADVPADYADIDTMALGVKLFVRGDVFGDPADAAPNGRQISSVAINDGVIDGDGKVICWAVADSTSEQLLATGEMAGAGDVTIGRTFSLEPIVIRMPSTGA